MNGAESTVLGDWRGTGHGAPPAPQPAYVIPKGTEELAWLVAAAWAEVPVAVLLQDTVTVRATHYHAGLRVRAVVQGWLTREDTAAERLADSHAAEATAGGSVADDIARLVAEVQGTSEDAFLEHDWFARTMVMAEGLAALTAEARDRGDAATAARYSEVQTSLLQVAAGLQAMQDNNEMGK